MLDSSLSWELWAPAGVGGLVSTGITAMSLGYVQPFSFQIGPRPETKIVGIRHGVTEITLSDGRLVRATLHVKSVKTDPRKPGIVDLSFNVVAEVVTSPSRLIHDVHETIQ